MFAHSNYIADEQGVRLTLQDLVSQNSRNVENALTL